MTELTLLGVALRQHDEEYPFDVYPFAHQIELRQLFAENDEFVGVNDSPTGGGKTSSWLAPVLTERLDTVAVYPTNALVRDQYEAIERAAAATVTHDVAVLHVTADELRARREAYGVSTNGEVLDHWLETESRANDQVILLTNPDILVMMRRNLYRKRVSHYKDFHVAVVDEFHRADRKEQNTLRYLLDELYEEPACVAGLSKIVFLSATPDAEQERAFEDAMAAPYYRVTGNDSGERRAFADPDSLGDDWHPVMPPVTLDVRTAPTFKAADAILGDEFEETLAFCRGGQTVIMLDGIHEVQRVYDRLSEELDVQVERIDGFHREDVDEKLNSFDVLVSNSAVEVGINFDVDRVLFAGHSKSSFLQRLGRLRDGEEPRTARCYVPHGAAGLLGDHDEDTLSRTDLNEVLELAYDDPRQPETFDARYSAAEAREHLKRRCNNATTEQQEEITRESLDRIERHFSVGPDTEFSLGDLERFANAHNWRILTNMQWYRGDSIQALVWNVEERTLRTYDLFYLLRYGDVTFYTREEFEEEIPAKYASEVGSHAQFVDGFCLYRGTIETNDDGYGRDVSFTGSVLYDWLEEEPTDNGRQPRVVPGLEVCVDPNETGSRVRSIENVNARLSNRRERIGKKGGILCYPVYGNTTEVKQWYDLGPFFFLYPITIYGKQAHSLALGTDALYLHCHILEDNGFDQGEDDGGEFVGL